ncbi:MAG: hypothetical protein OER59_07450 [Desulfobulbaceae bacterium]|nr:hypothetical protein [Desulfobulbaceae bacterium]MDH3866128.1 hypothetical protein [Desulfobulbaceae bacterium]
MKKATDALWRPVLDAKVEEVDDVINTIECIFKELRRSMAGEIFLNC